MLLLMGSNRTTRKHKHSSHKKKIEKFDIIIFTFYSKKKLNKNEIIMKSFFVSTIALVLAVSQVTAFSTSSSFSGSQVSKAVVQNNNGLTMEYIPSGISKAQWAKMKEDEKNKKNGKNLGKSGITTFKSRSFSDWQKSGGKNLFPVNPKGKDPKDIPYMQRPGGRADDSDLVGKKKTGGFSFFGGKKKEPEPEPEAPKKDNFWTF